MERSRGLLLMLIATMAIIHLVQPQNQQEFISLDCGLPLEEMSPYIEPETGLLFSSDHDVIQTGEIGIVEDAVRASLLKPYMRLRYFPEGTRNCYNLSLQKGRKYLIRAWLIYGNYDGRDIKPKFDLFLGPNLWATVDLQEPGKKDTAEEILHTATSNSLQICLVKTGETTPFISSLELRPLGNNSYFTQSGSLKLLGRKYFSESKEYIRYPNDAYDRQWLPRFLQGTTQISTTSDMSNSDVYSAHQKSHLKPQQYPLLLYYLYSYFAEIQDLQADETREFIEVFNGEDFSIPVNPKKLEVTTMNKFYPSTCKGGKCSLQLKRTNRSTLPPLINACEIYRVITFPQSETNEEDVVAIKSIKDTYGLINRITWQGDPCVPQHLMWDGLNCRYKDISTPPRITYLNLSSTGLTGTIAASIQNLTQLEKLDLSNNNLTGELPDFLSNISFINLSENDLNGTVPQTLQRKGVLLHGNARLYHPGSFSKLPSKKIIAAIVASAAFVVILVTALVLFLAHRRKKPAVVEGPQLTRPKELVENKKKRKRFTYIEVLRMTNNFQSVLGKGGFGEVYLGTLYDSEQVAVKVHSGSSTDQGFKQFKAEVDLLLRVHHTNLVNLVGYCDEEDHLALIYEFLPNGDLKEHLSGKHGTPIINWGMRLRIALEAAQGLEYLHTGCTPSMIHRDVKTANILLGEHFQAKLADFGLSRSSPLVGESHVSTVVAGTPGYLDPEYHDTGRLSEKSDVYSFGVVLLEMITNKPVIDETREKSNITQWVMFELNRGEATRIIDPNLGVDYNSASVWNALLLAMSCADRSSTKRPTMSNVVSKLRECLENLRGDPELL
ncbi:hypothetical protein Bca52824_028337 [Brassica carinata]|uniref:non-specific serine/threonine protein kinase n=1 Tax=Brassica carinata TaxID=52824 RepID=A0A8X8AMN6_BRACI|nr:hypothetical protein Bca52824_028337 [Brassica carinata]